MKHLEIINLRLTGARPQGLVDEIRKSVADQSGLVKIHIYHNSTITTDLGIHLHLEADAGDPHVTELGIRLASSLKEYGMVDHSIWFEQPR